MELDCALDLLFRISNHDMIPFHDRHLKCATLTVALILHSNEWAHQLTVRNVVQFRRFAGHDSEKYKEQIRARNNN